MAKTIELENVGPVFKLIIPVPPDGGVVVLKSVNGGGKSSALEAVDKLIHRESGLTRRRGSTSSGRVEGLGATITIGAKTTVQGQIEVDHLEDRLSIAEFVDPKLKTPAAADKARVKALLSMTGVTADPSLFWPLIGGKEAFDQYVNPSATASDDIVEMAGAIKRQFEAKARDVEADAERLTGQIQAKKATIDGIDLADGGDDQAARDKHQACVIALDRLRERAKAVQENKDAVDLAQMRLNQAKANYKGPTAAVAAATLKAAVDAAVASGEVVQALERQLINAKADLAMKKNAAGVAETALSTAKQHEANMKGWEETITKTVGGTPPAQEVIDEAEAAVDMAQTEVDRGAIRRNAVNVQAEIETLREKLVEKGREMENLRLAAAGIEDVLSATVIAGGGPIKIVDGRLMVTTEAEEKEFHELSVGERWRMALDIAIPHVGEGGIIVVDQTAWEGLDPINRNEIACHVKGKNVTILTALPDVGELRAELFDPDHAEAAK